MNFNSLSIALVGPLPPPAGGMAGQTRQLADLLRQEGAEVTIVQTNAPYRPRWIAPMRGVRALPRLVAYIVRLWSVTGTVQLIHVMANSGWSWHLFAAPAIWIARLRKRPVVVNYRGGEALAFLERSQRWVRPSLRAASVLAVPSGFLQQVFARFGFATSVVPNIVDLDRFRPPAEPDAVARDGGPRPHSLAAPGTPPVALVARNLEPLYDIATALRAFALVHTELPQARLVVAGSGPDRARLETLARELGIAAAVEFTGQLDRRQMAEQFRRASVLLNPSTVDNMPNSLLEAMASGVPIVSTNVGGVPYLVAHERTALLVPPGDPRAMSDAILRLWSREPALAARLTAAGLVEAQRYTWGRVRDVLGGVYQTVLAPVAPA